MIVRILRKSVFTVVNCLLHHIRLMFTGEETVKRNGFSPIVALSSLLYIANAMAFWHYSNSMSVAFIFSLVTITSLVSDSLVCSPFWRTTDRLVSTTACKTMHFFRRINLQRICWSECLLVHIHSSHFCSTILPVSVKCVAVLWGPIRGLLFHTPSILTRIQLLFLGCCCIPLLFWSRRSVSHNQFVFRHSLWHLSSVLCAVQVARVIDFSC